MNNLNKQVRFNDSLDFLANYHATAILLGETIKNELPKKTLTENSKVRRLSNNVKMFIINYSDLNDKWGVEHNLKNLAGISTNLEALADKLNYMIGKYRSKDIKPFLTRIVTKKPFIQFQPNNKKFIEGGKRLWGNGFDEYGDVLGLGHFRWNHQAYLLSEFEIKRIKEYFNI